MGKTWRAGVRVSNGIWLDEKLRLRGLDCPELSTPEGKSRQTRRRWVDSRERGGWSGRGHGDGGCFSELRPRVGARFDGGSTRRAAGVPTGN